MSAAKNSKWNIPGWRIEQRYAPGVLIGNWAEEQHQFQAIKNLHNSTYRIDFKNFDDHRPDITIRRDARAKNVGLRPEHLFHHHGSKYAGASTKISWYDQQYNGRGNPSLPALRKWDSKKVAWVPERSDYPLLGEPTNFGLLGSFRQRWAQQIADEARGDYNTTYRTSYIPTDSASMVWNRYATPKTESTSMNKVNMVNKDMHYRNNKQLRFTENPPAVAQVDTCSSAPAAVKLPELVSVEH